MEVLRQYCNLPGYQRLCCKSCAANITTTSDQPQLTTPSSHGTQHTTATTTVQSTPSYTAIPSSAPLSYTPSTSMATMVTIIADTSQLNTTLSSTSTVPSNLPTHTSAISISSGTPENSTQHEEHPGTATTWPDHTATEGPTNIMENSLITSSPVETDAFTLRTTVTNNDAIDLTTSDWLEVTEHLSESVTIPSTPADHKRQEIETPAKTTTATMTTATSPVTSRTSTSKPAIQTEVTSEGNAINIPFRIIGVDNDVPVNNVISQRGRVFLRERTRNKRIEELLEEKRNFLLRLKREQAA